jgi:hypothetical protein
VYAAIRDSLRPQSDSDTILVADSTVVADFTDVSGYRLPTDSVVVNLIAELARVSAAQRPSSALGLPFANRVVSRVESDTILARQQYGPGRAGERTHPSPRFIYSFSPVAYTKDGLNAVVYYGYTCGYGLCGAGNVLWLTRRATDTEWRVQRQIYGWLN